MLKGKNIILGITGSIAAYKAAYITRLLIKEGANVKIVMTPYAKEFITPVTLATLSKNTVLSDFFHHDDGAWNSHVDLGLWADLMIVAPATATTIGKMANGVADNLLITTYLSAKCPVMIAPAMDLDMFKHPSTQRNLKTLKSYGNLIIEPISGELASGLDGKGRMEEPEKIVENINKFFAKKKDFEGKKIMITAGPTYENIDAVRFIGNYSSGKMGYAIAEEFNSRGAEVTLISGPVNIESNTEIKLIKVNTADEMYKASVREFKTSNIAIMSAAVADYKAKNKSNKKIKREKAELTIDLEANKDIAFELGQIKSKNQITIGFALETDNEEENAKKKIEKKNLDFIVLNSMNDKGAGFGSDTNKITIFDKHNKKTNFELKPKQEVAKDIIDYLAKKK
jgi:phosphopantothenoylcysteine decarboxylase/phosphopantothenate--cysteine ligase